MKKAALPTGSAAFLRTGLFFGAPLQEHGQDDPGSVGIILTVPLVSLFASLLLGKKKKRAG